MHTAKRTRQASDRQATRLSALTGWLRSLSLALLGLSAVICSAQLAADTNTSGDQRSTLQVESFTPQLPEFELRNELGELVDASDIASQSEPLVLNFIFTSCSTICPNLSGSLLGGLRELREAGVDARGISISIDPLNDSPRILKRYKARFGSPEEWTLLTGDFDDIRQLQRLLGAWRGNKMNHAPMTFIRPTKQGPWLRITGFATGQDLSRLMLSQLAESS
jgi:protein SCO1/2